VLSRSIAVSENPYTSPQERSDSPFSGKDTALSFDDLAPLCNASGWLKLLGVVNIIIGIFYCITIIGLIIGWLPIWIGVTLNRASNSLKAGYEQSNRHEIRSGMSSLALACKIIGVIVIIYLILMALYFLVIIAALLMGVFAGVQG